MFKGSKWAQEIVALQTPEGSWGYFHTLSQPTKERPITTEQALRRLSVLGYTIEDTPIRRAVDYMHACLIGEKTLPDRREKMHDWDIFTRLMLATWIRRFTPDDANANAAARMWAEVISGAFHSGCYDDKDYLRSYQACFQKQARGGRLVDFVSFYPVSLLVGCLASREEALFLEHVLRHETGIYYIYDAPLCVLPDQFMSKAAIRYLAAVELLADYERCRGKLAFVTDWLEQNRSEDGLWDMGSQAKDGVYYPLSDSWRRKADRVGDCTWRIGRLMSKIGCGT